MFMQNVMKDLWTQKNETSWSFLVCFCKLNPTIMYYFLLLVLFQVLSHSGFDIRERKPSIYVVLLPLPRCLQNFKMFISIKRVQKLKSCFNRMKALNFLPLIFFNFFKQQYFNSDSNEQPTKHEQMDLFLPLLRLFVENS